ncbi:MAG: hypothetical protein WC868_02815 [Bacteroidales bacterium]
MKIKRLIINIVLLVFILLPFLLWLSWKLTPRKHLNIFIMDKSVLSRDGLEHNAFNWVLTHKRYVKPDGGFYSIADDYFGFFPLENHKYYIRDLAKYTDKQLDSLSNLYQMAYFADTYGVYYNEWYRQKNRVKYSEKLYGGLDENDYLFLKKMKEKKKLIIAEFNFFAAPTCSEVREKTEKLFGLKWTGWTGRYFEMLDTIKNPELPYWVIRLYKEQHNGKWPFKKSGIIFVNDDETIAILENETHLKKEVPSVKSFEYGVEKFGIPDEINYPYWFDITLSADTNNKMISYYEIFPNVKGDSILNHHEIPKIFPAAFENIKDSPFYYFCGDYTDSHINNTFVKFNGIEYFKLFMLNESNKNDRTLFFWRYYLPIVEKILGRYTLNGH